MLMSVAQLQAVDNHGETVLHAAVNSRNEAINGEVVSFLLDTQHIDIEATDTNGWSALTHATYGGFPKITQLLLDAGANQTLQALAIQALEEWRDTPDLNAGMVKE
jgi:ankyrin repeat protein